MSLQSFSAMEAVKIGQQFDLHKAEASKFLGKDAKDLASFPLLSCLRYKPCEQHLTWM